MSSCLVSGKQLRQSAGRLRQCPVKGTCPGTGAGRARTPASSSLVRGEQLRQRAGRLQQSAEMANTEESSEMMIESVGMR